MSEARRILTGRFGRASLLDMDKPLGVHAHHQCHILVKVAGRDTAFHVEGRRCPLTPSSAVLVSASRPHSYEHEADEGTNTLILALHIEPEWLASIERSLTVSGSSSFFSQPSIEMPPQMRRLASRLADEIQGVDTSDASAIESTIFNFVIELVDRHSLWREVRNSASAGERLNDFRVRRAVNLIRNDLAREYSMEELARESGLSRAHLFELFKRYTNMTPALYANMLRVEAAISRLTRTNASLAEMGYDLGFSAPGHFTRFFRTNVGVAPSEFRRKAELLREPSLASC